MHVDGKRKEDKYQPGLTMLLKAKIYTNIKKLLNCHPYSIINFNCFSNF